MVVSESAGWTAKRKLEDDEKQSVAKLADGLARAVAGQSVSQTSAHCSILRNANLDWIVRCVASPIRSVRLRIRAIDAILSDRIPSRT